MMDEKMNNMKKERQREVRQLEESELNLRIDKDQPLIVEDQDEGAKKYN